MRGAIVATALSVLCSSAGAFTVRPRSNGGLGRSKPTVEEAVSSRSGAGGYWDVTSQYNKPSVRQLSENFRVQSGNNFERADSPVGKGFSPVSDMWVGYGDAW